ncbi:uncharacterized protein [Dermacentor andersoni]|uniref:uncharacterized protein isoform X7 n=1 Tax=Dermacentor andersoni TaxID=34620 RepID=UPI003B3A8075
MAPSRLFSGKNPCMLSRCGIVRVVEALISGRLKVEEVGTASVQASSPTAVNDVWHWQKENIIFGPPCSIFCTMCDVTFC